ncbi:MAG: cyclopropane fatty acyl phospholipid synthase [Nitrospirota bacterium]
MKELVQEILHPAGIVINGTNSYDLQIRDERVFRRILREGSLGFGEAYMDGWWECERLDEFFCRIMPCEPEQRLRKNPKLIAYLLKSRLLNAGSKAKAFTVGERHYDRGNELYRHMLDRRMVYSCAYWKDAQTLDDAQEAKLDLICRKIGLQEGDRVLDIGCGWGSFARYAAERYGVHVVGITVSREQAELCRELCSGLPIEIRLQDYREVKEVFDHIVSVGMFEHVGYKNYRTYMEVVHRCLKEEGLFLLHTIGRNSSQVATDQWIDKYIFPNSLVPSMKQISAAAERLFVIEDWHNFGHYYDPTLMAWFGNFDSNWDKLKKQYDERFYRMWKYYLLSCAGSFRARYLQVWQIVFSKKGVPGGYQPVR